MSDRKYSKEKLIAVEKKISSAIKKAKKAGLKLTQCEWGVSLYNNIDYAYPKEGKKYTWASEDGCCCPNGAVLLMFQPKQKDEHKAAMSSLGVTNPFLNGFIAGYDLTDPDSNDISNMQTSKKYIQGYELGVKFNKKLFGKKKKA